MIGTSFSKSCLNTFIGQQAKEGFYYRQEWLDLITSLYGYSVIPLITTDTNGGITGYLPLCFIQSPLIGRRLVTLPFSDFCPLLAADEGSANALIDQAIRLARELKVKISGAAYRCQ